VHLLVLMQQHKEPLDLQRLQKAFGGLQCCGADTPEQAAPEPRISIDTNKTTSDGERQHNQC
jgi:hypothetical protein